MLHFDDRPDRSLRSRLARLIAPLAASVVVLAAILFLVIVGGAH